MSMKRGPGGVPIDVPSIVPEKNKGSVDEKSKSNSSLFGSEDEAIVSPNKPLIGLFPSEPETVPAQGSELSPRSADSALTDEPTVLWQKKGGKANNESEDPVFVHQTTDAMADPVVGWLVIIDGPGKGSSLKLGNGQNSMGRGAEERIRIDFGDATISRNSHAIVTFDPRGKRFFIQQGSGSGKNQNLAYLNDEPVLVASPLEALSQIILGETTLLFVPLCGKNFTWS